jgi:hypothetical protein
MVQVGSTPKRVRRLTTGLAAALGLAFTVAGPVQAGPNLVTNGGFETGDFTGWTLSGNTGFMGVGCPGPAAFVFEGACAAFAGPVGSLGFLNQTIGLAIGDYYTLNFAWMSDGQTPGEFNVHFGPISLDLLNPPASASVLTPSFTFRATTASANLQFSFRDDPGCIFLDAVGGSSGTGIPCPAGHRFGRPFTGTPAQSRGIARNSN